MGKRVAAATAGQAGFTLVEILVTMIVLCIVTTMIIGGWIALQSSYAHTVNENDARSTAASALDFAANELRDAQPQQVTTPAQSPFTLASPDEVDYYSSHDQPGTASDGSGTGNLRLTRIYLDTATGKLWWQRDTDGNGAFDSGDRSILLASNVIDASTPDTSVSPSTPTTAVFTYGYLDANGALQTATSLTSTQLAAIVSVRVHLVVAASASRTTSPADLQITVVPRNAPDA